ncbi:MAG: DNA polymerase III subunit gamma/tau [Peptoniphilaceae bacterium]|nr:DNA polymerase III subunit gamma/tau [Peptoniphilaceae bacterium]MDY6018040.1 DNA polymerase III subunit gamma/tau [Anaerococcus sp.]
MAKALYRQYRPKTFDQVLGQDRVVNVLKNQVEKGMISHAYLFAGERGCGKTTCAKIFAKAINCKNQKNGSPCLVCENCKAIDEETTMDVVEMDAASNRRIDDIRALKETVMYPPNNLKYKVYIIDEAHMITKEAFNALLKIMEEPPSHLVFILATTEIDKIPSTILSRVQKFEFNKIDKEQILKQINIILDDYSIKMDQAAKELIINNANGAMRDALSILDQVISSSKDSYTLSDVEEILGVVGIKDIYNLASSINSYDKKSALQDVFSLRVNNKSNKDILDGLTSFYHDILIYKSIMDESYFDQEERFEYIKKMAASIDNSRLMDSLEILSQYAEKMKYSDNTDLILELTVFRLIDYKDIKSIESRLNALEKENTSSLADMVNSILDNRLENLDLNKVNINRALANDNQEDEKNIELNSKKESINNEEIPQISDEDVKKLDDLTDQKTANPLAKETVLTKDKISNTSLDKKTEDQIKDEIIKQVGPLIRTMFTIEGFNYELKDQVFYLYYKDSIYYMSLANKRDAIEKIVRDFTNKSLEVKIIKEFEKKSSDEIKEENKNSEIEENQALKKLEKIFGDQLIIE